MKKTIMKTGYFDTHTVVKRLQGAGLSIEAAEEITQSILLGRDYDISMLASKTDFFDLKENIAKVESEIITIKGEIEALRTETKSDTAGLKKDIESLKKEIVAEIAQHKSSMLQWMVGFFAAQMTVVIGVLVTILIKTHI